MEPKEFNVKGQCMDMCPSNELNRREKERLLHVLEMVPGTEKTKPKADRTKTVKSFSRSAAGKMLQDPKNLRPPEVLLRTVNYLLNEVIVNTRVPWNVTYDFLMDRLRSVRQDMIVQNVSIANSICILQPLIRFYAYASYRLCEEPLNNYDPFLNRTHLQECLKRLLCLYDECDIKYRDVAVAEESYFMQQISKLRPEFEALYLVLNLGDHNALTRALCLDRKWRNNIVQLAMVLSLSYGNNNFVRVCRLMKQLPILLLGVASLHLPEIRRRSFQIMSVAYHSKNLTFPVDVLKNILLFDNLEDVIKECQYYGIECTKQGVHFIKNVFDHTKTPVQPRHLNFMDEKLTGVKINSLILT